MSQNDSLYSIHRPVTATLRTGIRIPDSPFIRQLCSAFKGAIALTSANVSGGENSLAVDDFRDLWSQCGAVYDDGPIPASPLGSTVVDLSRPGRYIILRPGVAEAATRSTLERHGMHDGG
jgi:tRNA A37 threonylcarbamoyladenosine synthetase subunit TsaC/SUA5/YrdC